MSLVTTFRAARWLRTFHLLAQAALLLTFFGGLNYLSLRYSPRYDLTELHKHSLSAQTEAYLRQLKQPVRVVITFNPKDPDPSVARIARDVSELLREYHYASENNPRGRISVETLNVDERPREAERLNLAPNSILLLSHDGQREARREIRIEDLYRFENKRPVAFLGEQAMTAAILDVSSPGKKKIYFLSGHGEMDLNAVSSTSLRGTGLSELRDRLRLVNIEPEILDLARARKIPDDAALVISAGARSRYEDTEQELLRRYLSDSAGRLMLLIEPGIAPSGLEALLYDWGIVADNVLICDNSPSGKNENGDLILGTYVPHQITQFLAETKLLLRFARARSVRKNPSAPADPSLKITSLIQTSETAWGERDYLKEQRFTPVSDLAGRLTVASAAERLAAKDGLPLSVPVGRLVVFGSADFVANGRLGAVGNEFVFFNAMNWLLDRDTQLNIPIRAVESYQISLSQSDLVRLRYSILFALPAAAAALGLLVYWTRRR